MGIVQSHRTYAGSRYRITEVVVAVAYTGTTFTIKSLHTKRLTVRALSAVEAVAVEASHQTHTLAPVVARDMRALVNNGAACCACVAVGTRACKPIQHAMAGAVNTRT